MKDEILLDPRKHGISQGLLTTFMRCRKEAEYYVKGLKRPQASQAMQFGTLAHSVLEKIYSKWNIHPNEIEVRHQINKAIKDYKKEEGTLSVEAMEHLEINHTLLDAVMPSYFLYYKKDFKGVKWQELEERFSIPSPCGSGNLVGRIDGVQEKKISKELWLFESKTKSRIEESSLVDALAFDFQTFFYLSIVWKKYKKLPSGTIYNVIRRPGQRLGKTENLKAFGERVKKEVLLEPDKYFVRFEVAVPKSELEKFNQELGSILDDFVAWFDFPEASYRNTTACQQRFGPCKYLPLCATGDRELYTVNKTIYPELQEE